MNTEKSETRTIVNVKTYNPKATASRPASTVVEYSSSWSFFENEKECYLTGHDIVARRALNPHQRCEFVYWRGDGQSIPFFESSPERPFEVLGQERFGEERFLGEVRYRARVCSGKSHLESNSGKL
ncbi:unnamed protein product [Allacma fusca]|uniref:Uncharacterized protein n=1 Tax=Allacma fusca TaxID=39272 RepID=A0A8J2JNK8_9HEXA|nr:unnamed protein product [Allacma fusca]